MRKLSLNDRVTISRRGWYACGRILRVSKVYKNGDIQLSFVYGKDKGVPIELYRPADLLRLPELRG